MYQSSSHSLPVIPHAGYLGEQEQVPAYIDTPSTGSQILPFYVGGQSGEILIQQTEFKSETWGFAPGNYLLRCYFLGQFMEREAILNPEGLLETQGSGLIAVRGDIFLAELESEEQSWTLLLREYSTQTQAQICQQSFQIYRSVLKRTDREIQQSSDQSRFAHLQVSMGESHGLYPLQLMPSVLDVTGRRISLYYPEAIERLAEIVLAHRPPYGRTLVYVDQSVDFFGIFALQEVLRLLGVRNLYGSSIWGPQALAQGARFQQGHIGPGLSIDHALNGSNRVFILNGWNGFVTHLPLFERLLQQNELNAWLISVMTSETAKVLADQIGTERILLIRPGSESILALAIAHELLTKYPDAIDHDFCLSHSDQNSYQEYLALAKSSLFHPEEVSRTIAPEPHYESSLLAGIQAIASQLARTENVPIHIPGQDLLQGGGQTAYCLWNNLWALLGKLPVSGAQEAEIRGGELRIVCEGNEEIQLHSLSPDLMFGGLSCDAAGIQEAATRMGLPTDAYALLQKEGLRPILDFSDPDQSNQRELILCIGTGLESRWMRDHELWQERLKSPTTKLIVIDPMPGPFLLQNADLCLPSAYTVCNEQLEQNGEWSFIHAYPRRQNPSEVRTISSLIYDTMAEVSRSLRESEALQIAHPDLAKLSQSGVLASRFESPEKNELGELQRTQGEVNRRQLWLRIQDYLSGLVTAPYIRAGRPMAWDDLHNGVQSAEYPQNSAFVDIHNQPMSFRFFVPQESDFILPEGVLLTIGSSIPDPGWSEVRFAIAASHNGFSLRHSDMPANRYLYVSESIADSYDLQEGQEITLTHSDDQAVSCKIQISNWLKGKMVYLHHYLTQAELNGNAQIPWLRFKTEICPYSQVPLLKKVQVHLEKESLSNE